MNFQLPLYTKNSLGHCRYVYDDIIMQICACVRDKAAERNAGLRVCVCVCKFTFIMQIDHPIS